jgi:hypothetical protein
MQQSAPTWRVRSWIIRYGRLAVPTFASRSQAIHVSRFAMNSGKDVSGVVHRGWGYIIEGGDKVLRCISLSLLRPSSLQL